MKWLGLKVLSFSKSAFERKKNIYVGYLTKYLIKLIQNIPLHYDVEKNKCVGRNKRVGRIFIGILIIM